MKHTKDLLNYFQRYTFWKMVQNLYIYKYVLKFNINFSVNGISTVQTNFVHNCIFFSVTSNIFTLRTKTRRQKGLTHQLTISLRLSILIEFFYQFLVLKIKVHTHAHALVFQHHPLHLKTFFCQNVVYHLCAISPLYSQMLVKIPLIF